MTPTFIERVRHAVYWAICEAIEQRLAFTWISERKPSDHFWHA